MKKPKDGDGTGLRILVHGPIASGKSTLAELVVGILKLYGIPVELQDEDEQNRQPLYRRVAAVTERLIERDSPIVVKTMTVGKGERTP